MSQDNITIFWDYASTYALSAGTIISNYDLVTNIRSTCLEMGMIKSFRAYGNFSAQISARISTAHSELAASGVTVIDFPDSARKEAGIKTMLVDMITYAWDYPAGHTYVIISGDRDVGYAVAMLRMRRIKVVVISPVTAHPDLTAHASMKLDWTKTALGYQNGTPHFMNPFDSKPAPSEKPNPPSYEQQSHSDGPFGSRSNKGPSSAQSRKPMEAESVELRDIQPRGSRQPVFSAHDPRRLGVFGDIGDAPSTPKTQRGLFGFEDDPLFSRHEEETLRAESVPPHVLHSSNLSKSTSVSTASSGKGKSHKFSDFEPETLPPPPKIDGLYPGSTSFGAMSAFPPSEHKAETISRSSSSNSSPSQPTNFSTVTMKRPDTTAPTSATSNVIDTHTPAVDEQGDMKLSQTTISHTGEPVPSSVTTEVILNESILLLPIKDDVPNPVSAAISRRNSTSRTETGSQATDYERVRTSEPVLNRSESIHTVQLAAGLGQPVVTKPVVHSPAPAPRVPAVPSSFQPLVTVLERERDPISKSILGAQLVQQNSRVYELAGIPIGKNSKPFKAYVTAAAQAGIVSETRDAVTLLAEFRT